MTHKTLEKWAKYNYFMTYFLLTSLLQIWQVCFKKTIYGPQTVVWFSPSNISWRWMRVNGATARWSAKPRVAMIENANDCRNASSDRRCHRRRSQKPTSAKLQLHFFLYRPPLFNATFITRRRSNHRCRCWPTSGSLARLLSRSFFHSLAPTSPLPRIALSAVPAPANWNAACGTVTH